MVERPFAGGRTLVVAFEGWNDAGEAASNAVRRFREATDAVVIAELEPEDYFDYQFNRPSVAEIDGARVIVWPGVAMHAATQQLAGIAETNLYFLSGSEPSRGWKTFTREVLDVVEAHEITAVVFLGAMLADVPHTRPISVFATSENAEVRQSLAVERSGYEGPVGILSVLADAAERAGIVTVSIWASVPHYVHNAPSPKATLALIEKLEDLIGVTVGRGDLQTEAEAWETGIDALAGDDEDMASYIEQLEQARDTVDSPEASGDAIAEEFERYLRGGDKPEAGAAGDEPWPRQ